MDFTKVEKELGPASWPVVELRQYTLHSGKRDQLIELFEREFVESQEEVGMRIIGTFRDLDNPDRFVWLRGFTSMASRAAQLAAFYGGPIWKAHREAANATMIDSDNVLLLRPATARSGFDLAGCTRAAAADKADSKKGLIMTTIYQPKDDEEEFAEFFMQHIVPQLRAAGVPILAAFVSEHHPNTFPALPVREDAKVFVWFTRARDRTDFDQKSGSEVLAKLRPRLQTDPEVFLLEPTTRSLWPGSSTAHQ